MKYSPRTASNLLKIKDRSLLVAMYPETDLDQETALYGFDGEVCHLQIQGEFLSDVAQRLSIMLTQYDRVAFTNAREIMTKPELAGIVFTAVLNMEKLKQTLVLCFEPGSKESGETLWLSSAIQNKFTHLEVSGAVPLDLSPIPATQ